jgi:hypothetical protein
MAVWWAATDEERTATYQVRGLGHRDHAGHREADLQIVGGGSQAALQVSRTRPLRLQATRRRPSASCAAASLRLRSRCPAGADRQLLLRLPACACPTTCPVTVRTTSGDVSVQRLPRLGAGSTPTSGDVELRTAVRLQPADPRDVGDVRAVAACTPERLQLRSRAGPRATRSCRPAATASTPRATRASAACAA